MGGEGSLVALREIYSQVLNTIDGKLVRMARQENLALLKDRLSMLEHLNRWACSLEAGRRQSRGLFVLMERFYLNHIAAVRGPQMRI